MITVISTTLKIDLNLEQIMVRYGCLQALEMEPLAHEVERERGMKTANLPTISIHRSESDIRSCESPEKNLRLERDSNPRPPRYRCDALPTEL